MLLLLLLSLGNPAFAQEQSTPTHYRFRGVIEDEDSTVFPGLRLRFRSSGPEITTLTDLDGEFDVKLPEGDFVMTADGLDVRDFRVFLKIGSNGLNPNFLNLKAEWVKMECLEYTLKPLPKILNSVAPAYPFGNTRNAVGEVTIRVEILPNGNVVSATGVSGHPFLRAAALEAAKKFIFEAVETTVKRDAILTFVFLWSDANSPGLKRERCPGRIIIPLPDQTIVVSV